MISKSRTGGQSQVQMGHLLVERLGGRAKSGKKLIKKKPRAACLKLHPVNHLPAQLYLLVNQQMRSVMEVVSVEN
jgi:hypothetical protein